MIGTEKVRLTVVTPVFNESDNLPEFCETVRKVLFNQPDLDVDLIFVDDGSPDSSWSLISETCEADPRFHAIRLSRNFGSHAALSAGIIEAQGDVVATLACDLQDPPETIIEFVAKWRDGAKVVWGHRLTNDDPILRRLASKTFNTVVRRAAMPPNSKFSTGSFFLIDRDVVECFRQFRDHSRITFALVAWTGFKQDIVLYHRGSRRAGKSGWTTARLIHAMYDVLVGYSALPARVMTGFGFGLFLVSIFFSLYLVLEWAVYEVQPGWTGIMVTLLILFSIMVLMLGLITEYLHRIYMESTNRPLYFVSERIGEPLGRS